MSAQRLIEMVVGPCTRAQLDRYLIEVQELVDERLPHLDAAIGGRYSLGIGDVVVRLTKREKQAILSSALRNAEWPNARQSLAQQSAMFKLREAILKADRAS